MSENKTTENEPSHSSVPQQQSSERNEEKEQKLNLSQLFTKLTTEINSAHHNCEGFARDNDEQSETKKFVYGYVSKTTETMSQGNKFRTRNQNYAKLRRTQHSAVKSPNGPFNHLIKNVGLYRSDTDPNLYPLRVFRIRVTDLNMDSNTFDANKAILLTDQELKNMTEEDLAELPVMVGKTEIDTKGELVVRPYELIQGGRGTQKWRPHDTLLQISDYGHAVAPYLLNRGDEVQFTLANDLQGNPFAIRITKISMVNNGPNQKNFGVNAKPYTYRCDLTGTKVSTDTTNQTIEMDTYQAKSISHVLEKTYTQGAKHLNLIPSSKLSFTDVTLPLAKPRDFITAGDLNSILQRKNMPGRWHDQSMDAIHALFLELFTTEALAEMEKQGVINNDKKGHWVIHHTQDNVTNITARMVQNDYNNQHNHKYILSTTLITKTNLQGRTGGIDSQLECGRLSQTWTNPEGYEVPLQIRNFDYHRILNCQKPDITTVNIKLDMHRFTDNGDKLPADITVVNPDVPKGKAKEFKILFTEDNTKVKDTLAQLANIHPTKHIQISYPFGNDGNPARKRNSLMWGRFRVANIKVLSNATDEVVRKLMEAGVSSIGPKNRDLYDHCKIRSKHFLPFPKKIEELMRSGKFKMVEIADKGLFYLYPCDNQTDQDINSVLDLTNPSEFDSVCLTTPNDSPWTEFGRNGKSILLNKIYDEKVPDNINVIYISGIEAITDAEWIQNLIKKYTDLDIVVVEKKEETKEPGNVQVRYLQKMGHHNDRECNYTIAISSENEPYLMQLKQKTNELRLKSGAKYDTSHAGLNRLQHVLDVISDKSERTECNLPTVSLPNQSNPQTDKTGDEGEWKEATDKKKAKKKRKKNTNPNTDGKSKPSGSTSNNKYDALNNQDNEDDEDEKEEERNEEEGDFNINKDTLVTSYMEDYVQELAKKLEDYTEEKFEKLIFVSIKLVVSADQAYNTKSKLPNWFTQKKPRLGLGPILIQYFTKTETKEAGSIDSMLEQLNKVDPLDQRRWDNLRKNLHAIQEQNAQNRAHRKNTENKNQNAAIALQVTTKRQPAQTPTSRNTKQRTLSFVPTSPKVGSKDKEDEDQPMTQ